MNGFKQKRNGTDKEQSITVTHITLSTVFKAIIVELSCFLLTLSVNQRHVQGIPKPGFFQLIIPLQGTRCMYTLTTMHAFVLRFLSVRVVLHGNVEHDLTVGKGL
jgi:hypothetical protein